MKKMKTYYVVCVNTEDEMSYPDAVFTTKEDAKRYVESMRFKYYNSCYDDDYNDDYMIFKVKSPDDFSTVNHPKKVVINAKIEQFTGYEPSVYGLQIKSYDEYSKYDQDTLNFTHNIFSTEFEKTAAVTLLTLLLDVPKHMSFDEFKDYAECAVLAFYRKEKEKSSK